MSEIDQQEGHGCTREQLIEFYDELAEVVALNNFLYDTFLRIADEEKLDIEGSAAIGLSVICRWMKARQSGLKEHFKTLME